MSQSGVLKKIAGVQLVLSGLSGLPALLFLSDWGWESDWVVALLYSILSGLAGIGLLRLRRWGRVPSIITWFINLFAVGSIAYESYSVRSELYLAALFLLLGGACVAAIWFLFRPQVRELFTHGERRSEFLALRHGINLCLFLVVLNLYWTRGVAKATFMGLPEKQALLFWQAAYVGILVIGYWQLAGRKAKSWTPALLLLAIVVDTFAVRAFIGRPTGDESTGFVAMAFIPGKVVALVLVGRALIAERKIRAELARQED